MNIKYFETVIRKNDPIKYDLTNKLDQFLNKFPEFTENEIKEHLQVCQEIINNNYNVEKEYELYYKVDNLLDSLENNKFFKFTKEEIINTIMARQRKELDLSVEITFKDGHKEIYPNLVEASEACGISESAIKIRCNKSREGSTNKKDKIGARWVSDTTFRSYQAKKSKNKGAGFETQVVSKLKELGYENVCRAAGESKKLDNNKVDIADPSGELEFALQCKATQNLPNYYTIREACTDPRELILLWKKSAEENSISKGTLAIMPIDLFYELLKLYHSSK